MQIVQSDWEVNGLAGCITELADFLHENKKEILQADGLRKKEILEDLRNCLEALPIESLRLLQAGNPERAYDMLNDWYDICESYLGHVSFIYGKLIIPVTVALSRYESAERYCRAWIENGLRDDENIWFYLGNAYAGWGKRQEAVSAYQEALKLKENFREARENLYAVQENMKARHFFPQENILRFQPEDYRSIPIFINSRDRVECLRKLVDWLLEARYANIILLDNASTYPPLLRYYDEICALPQVRCIRFHENLGHTALWDSGILEQMQIHTPYVYTDSDVLPVEDCPKEILRDMVGILKQHPYLDKVGLGLRIDDITYYDAGRKQAWEKQFYHFPMEDGLVFAPVDTTFALYQNMRHYSLYIAARTTGRRMARHLPWYYDYDHLPEDEAYYMKHANSSSTLSKEAGNKSEDPFKNYRWLGFF